MDNLNIPEHVKRTYKQHSVCTLCDTHFARVQHHPKFLIRYCTCGKRIVIHLQQGTLYEGVLHSRPANSKPLFEDNEPELVAHFETKDFIYPSKQERYFHVQQMRKKGWKELPQMQRLDPVSQKFYQHYASFQRAIRPSSLSGGEPL